MSYLHIGRPRYAPANQPAITSSRQGRRDSNERGWDGGLRRLPRELLFWMAGAVPFDMAAIARGLHRRFRWHARRRRWQLVGGNGIAFEMQPGTRHVRWRKNRRDANAIGSDGSACWDLGLTMTCTSANSSCDNVHMCRALAIYRCELPVPGLVKRTMELLDYRSPHRPFWTPGYRSPHRFLTIQSTDIARHLFLVTKRSHHIWKL